MKVVGSFDVLLKMIRLRLRISLFLTVQVLDASKIKFEPFLEIAASYFM